MIRLADAVLQALIMIRSSMSPSFISLGFVDWRMNTVGETLVRKKHSVQSQKENRTIFVANTFTYRHTRFLIRVLKDQDLGHFNPQSVRQLASHIPVA